MVNIQCNFNPTVHSDTHLSGYRIPIMQWCRSGGFVRHPCGRSFSSFGLLMIRNRALMFLRRHSCSHVFVYALSLGSIHVRYLCVKFTLRALMLLQSLRDEQTHVTWCTKSFTSITVSVSWNNVQCSTADFSVEGIMSGRLFWTCIFRSPSDRALTNCITWTLSV